MAGIWDQTKFDAALAQKYRNQTVQTNAAAAEARANAFKTTEAAKVVAPLAQSSITTDKANNALTSMNTAWLPKKYQADINNSNASTNFLNTQNQWYGPKAVADIALGRAQGLELNSRTVETLHNTNNELNPPPVAGASASILNEMLKPSGMTQMPALTASAGGYAGGMGGDTAPAPINVLTAPAGPVASKRSPLSFDDGSSFLRPSSLMGGNLKPFGTFKRGVTSVPGRGSGDKMPALLEPKEAVLNKHAADTLGRAKIAQLNKAGNQKRAKDNAQRVSKLAQALKQHGMI